MPTAVVSAGRMRGEVVEHCDTIFRFADASLAVSATSGVVNQQGRPFTHGYELHLEKATLQFELAVLADGQLESMPLKVLLPNGKIERPTFAGDPMLTAFEFEIKEVVSCIKKNRPSELLGAELARDAIVLCHKQTEAVRKGTIVKV
jgi:predicted dehydrogenase